MSKFFINRPIFATVLAIIMILAGVVTFHSLPIAQYPDITPPTVMVIASYPGADAQTVAQVIAEPIEEQVNGVEDMMYMSSSSSDGQYMLTITFERGTDLDNAAVKVQNRVSQAEPTLPTVVREEGINVMTRSSNILLFVALEGSQEGQDALYLSNYARLHMVDAISRVEGVGQVGAFGGGSYSMRIWLDPQKMRMYGVDPTDVEAAIQSQNIQVSAGGVGEPPVGNGQQFTYTLSAHGRLSTPEEFGDIVIKGGENGSGILHLRDIAHVELGSSSYSNVTQVNGNQAAMLAIYQLPGSNAMEVAGKVKAELKNLEQYFPEGVSYAIVQDSTEFVSASIDNVVVTAAETMLIVLIVILFFLQSARAVIIPMLTIPVSLIATLAVMKLMGFSLNTLTLFGLVLAIAIVVDDAIVVVEDCQRIVDKRIMTPRQAAIKAMNELTGPIIGEVLVLISVFVPTAFISGITGQLYKQFALTIAVSTAFSGFNALTFTPAMCALFLRPAKQGKQTTFFLFKWFNKGYNATLNAYNKTVGKMLRRPLLSTLFYLALCILAFWLYGNRPTNYIPEEDMGYFMSSIQLPAGSSLERTDSIVNEASARVRKLPQVKTVLAFSGQSFMGGSGSNYGSMFVVLKPWDERKGKDNNVTSVINAADAACADIQEAIIFSANPPAIPGLGMTAGLEMELLDINNYGSEAMSQAIDDVIAEAEKSGKLSSARSLYQIGSPQYSLKVDRTRLATLGLEVSDVFNALSAYMGTEYVNDFNAFGRTYQVIMSADEKTRSKVENLRQLSAVNSSGQMVPFSAFTSVEKTLGQSGVNRYNMYTSGTITGTVAKGSSMSEGIAAMEAAVKKVLGNEYSYAWTGEAYQQTQSGATITTALLFAVIITLLVLAAQYESWTDPIAVIIAMPTAILGTVIGTIFMGQDIVIYTQIGIILLLGLAAKNAILIVEYAMDFRKQGKPIVQAAADAGSIRFRPIMMTALAFVFGVMPMLFSTGAGANSRIALGSAVVFGMAVNAIMGTLFVPGFWVLLQKLREKYLSGLFASADKVPAPADGNSEKVL